MIKIISHVLRKANISYQDWDQYHNKLGTSHFRRNFPSLLAQRSIKGERLIPRGVNITLPERWAPIYVRAYFPQISREFLTSNQKYNHANRSGGNFPPNTIIMLRGVHVSKKHEPWKPPPHKTTQKSIHVPYHRSTCGSSLDLFRTHLAQTIFAPWQRHLQAKWWISIKVPSPATLVVLVH